MGVTGLWKLVEPCGKPVPVETLEGKTLAVDISIWLHQVVKGFQDNKGNALPNAHLLGLFNRLCKLLYYRVKPVFVFDGGVPQLKRDTIVKRQQQRGKLNSEADRIENLIVKALAREKVVQQALGGNVEGLLKSPAKRATKRSEDTMDELFKLPELPTSSTNTTVESEEQIDPESSFSTDDYDTEESSFDEKNTRYSYDTNLQAIDVRSKHFRELPAEVRHEILVDIKETRKHSWGRLHELPACSNQFSQLQMKRLLKRRAVQESLEEVEQELGGRSLTYSELINYFTEEGVLEKSAMENVAKPICSDENTRFLLVRDLKKKLEAETSKSENMNTKSESTKREALPKIEEEEPPKKIEKKEEEKGEKTKDAKDEKTEGAESTKKDNSLGREYDIDLQLALALSAEDDEVYRKEDYEYESDLQLRLNSKQRRLLNQAVKGPARAYMIEYGGMNDSEVNGIMDETQNNNQNTLHEFELMMTKEDITDVTNESKIEMQNAEVVEIIDSDTDSDLEEVPVKEEETTESKKKALQIVFDLKEPLAPQDDLFADIFDEEREKSSNDAHNVVERVEKQDEMPIIDEGKDNRSLKDPQSVVNNIEEKSERPETLQKNKSSTETVSDSKKEPLVVKDSSNIAIINILDELKKQANDATQINLDDIKVSNSVIELSDEDVPATSVKDDVVMLLSTPKKQFSPRNATKSPRTESPSNKKITEYFDTNYVIKRTPDKVIETEVVPKIKSPFFIKKTPKSGRKDSPTPSTSAEKKVSKVAKTLFEDKKSESELNTASKPSTVQEVIEEAAQVLKEQNTEDELATLASDLARERRVLESERNRQDRMGMTISERMSDDCQELLRLFGIPYIVAPMEAEAQCAFLDYNNLTNGTITDDSDIWLFGGRTVYKNFFATNKNVLEYHAEKIEQILNCDRKRLIQLACLVGSDYTNGVHGIGTVTALEILASFATSKEGSASESEANMRHNISAILTTLFRFRDWWQVHKAAAAPPGSSVRLALSKKLKNIDLDESFPSVAVVEAYLMPTVDDNREAFSWGNPDVESIREFARKTFGWTRIKTDETLMPVMKRLNEKKSQATIKNYFAVKSVLLNQQLKVSKRVQTAVNKLAGNEEEEIETAKEKPKRVRHTKRKQSIDEGKKSKSAKVKKHVEEAKECDDIMSEQPSTSQRNLRGKKIATNKEVIPQREKDLEEMEKNKKLAAEIFKNSSKKNVKS